jgi:hypothetical protein
MSQSIQYKGRSRLVFQGERGGNYVFDDDDNRVYVTEREIAAGRKPVLTSVTTDTVVRKRASTEYAIYKGQPKVVWVSSRGASYIYDDKGRKIYLTNKESNADAKDDNQVHNKPRALTGEDMFRHDHGHSMQVETKLFIPVFTTISDSLHKIEKHMMDCNAGVDVHDIEIRFMCIDRKNFEDFFAAAKSKYLGCDVRRKNEDTLQLVWKDMMSGLNI